MKVKRNFITTLNIRVIKHDNCKITKLTERLNIIQIVFETLLLQISFAARTQRKENIYYIKTKYKI
jgi:hypothetical protein